MTRVIPEFMVLAIAFSRDAANCCAGGGIAAAYCVIGMHAVAFGDRRCGRPLRGSSRPAMRVLPPASTTSRRLDHVRR
jgi:hypothetical protein